MTTARDRRAARVIVRDRGGAVLLMRGGDPSRPEAGRWWFTPGGGVEPGESEEQAAERELFEETGLVGVDLRRLAVQRDVEFSFGGVLIRQHEVYFTVTVPRFAPDRSGWTELERRAQDDMRWWDPEELTATSETVYPEGLRALLD
jgi:ADP-ribose pyrophosphatase YjhB (NUDIX family)